jgi:hypothetical protein
MQFKVDIFLADYLQVSQWLNASITIADNPQ